MIRCIAALLLLLAAAPAAGQGAPAGDPGLADFAAEVERAYETGDFIGLAVAVVKDGETALMRTYGVRGLDDPAPVDPATRFRIASLSKGFAATLAAQLAAEGRLTLEAPVRETAPFFRLKARTPPTLEHVLSHRLGLPPYAYDNLLEAGVPVASIFDRLATLDPLCPPGRCYTYQNVAYSLVEPAVEAASGLAFEQAMAIRLFRPLGLERASFGLDALVADPNWAHPHVRDGREGPWRPIPPTSAYDRVPSAGGINASIADMAAWLKAQMGHAPAVLPPEVLSLVHTPRVATRAELRRLRTLRDRVDDAHYALGWRVYGYAGRTVVVHSGALRGYRAQIAFAPDEGIGLVALWNSMSDRGWGLMPALFDRHFGLAADDWLRLDCAGKGADAAYCPAGAASLHSSAR